MNCHNGEAYLRKAIESIYSQTYADWEIIFFDNASEDRTAEIARDWDERLRYYRSEVKLSLGEARNEALKETRGKYISFLDCDDWWLSKKLEIQVKAMERMPSVDFMYSNYYLKIHNRKRLRLGYTKKQPSGNIFRYLLKVYSINLQTVMLRTEALNALGTWFDPILHLSEEYDLFLRLLIKKEAFYEERPLVVYRIHKRMGSIAMKEKYPEENRYVLNKFIGSIPHFEEEYEEEVKYLRAKIAYWEARHLIENDVRSARKVLAPHKRVSWAFFILYIASLMGRGAWQGLHLMKRKYI